MHILVSNQHVRTAIVIQGSATVYELKEKVARQTSTAKKQTDWPADEQVLLLNGEVLCDEMTLVECGLQDRDRIQLELLAPSQQQQQQQEQSGVGSSALLAALNSLEQVAKLLDGHDVQLHNGEPVHQEYFTRLLESLDSITLDGLSEEERTLVRKQRKELVLRAEACSDRARLVR